ncbi:MAG: hypothetical protein P8Z38_12280 [Robiginitalea sp.]
MEAIRKRLKATARLLSILLLAQSCSIYHKTPTTLENASQERVKTKVTNIDGAVSRYKFISYEAGVYYGNVEEDWGVYKKVPLESEDIIQVRTKNKTASTLVTMVAITIPVIAFAGYMIAESFTLGGSGF